MSHSSPLAIIDRFEGDWAILELPDKTTFNFPRSFLPKGAKEGDVLKFDISIDKEATKERREHMKNLLDELKSQDQGGDIEL